MLHLLYHPSIWAADSKWQHDFTLLWRHHSHHNVLTDVQCATCIYLHSYRQRICFNMHWPTVSGSISFCITHQRGNQLSGHWTWHVQMDVWSTVTEKWSRYLYGHLYKMVKSLFYHLFKHTGIFSFIIFGLNNIIIHIYFSHAHLHASRHTLKWTAQNLLLCFTKCLTITYFCSVTG